LRHGSRRPLRAGLASRGLAPGGKGALLLLGIDIGGTKTVLALGDATGQVRARLRRSTEPSGDAGRDLARLAEDARRLVVEAGVALSGVAAVGVSLPGPLDLDAGLVLNPPNLPGWHRAPVRDALGAALGRPVHLENDANAAALAEWRWGAGRGTQHLVYLSMSTGVGGGLVLGGRLHRGVASSAGEVGHMPLVWDGEPCACGLRGCLEAYVGGAAWTRRLARVTPEASRVAVLAGGASNARPEHVVEAAREGDAFAVAELARYNDHLSRALVQLTFVLAPEIFVLGTIPSAAGEALCLGPVRERVRAHTWGFLGEGLRIEPSALGARLPECAGLVVAAEALGAVSG
jgi:glucokinase